MNELEIPKGWRFGRLEEILKLEKGRKPGQTYKERTNTSLPYLDIKALEKDDFGLFADSKDGVLCKDSDVLIVWDGSRSGLCLMGKSGLVGSTIMKLNIKEKVNPKFLYYFLLSKYSLLNSKTKGGAIPHVNGEIFGDLEIPIPPEYIQEKIVQKLDHLLGQLEKKKKMLFSIGNIEHIKKLPKIQFEYTLDLACSGKLTENWRKDHRDIETAEILLKRILAKRKIKYEKLMRDAKKDGLRKPTKIYPDKIPHVDNILNSHLPKTWSLTTVDFLAHVTKLAGFEYTKYITPQDSGEIPIIRAQNVKMGRFSEENLKYISKKTSNLLPRSQINGSEILMVFIGAGTGNVCLAPTDRRWHLAPNVAKIDVNGIEREYLYYYLQSPMGLKNTLSRMNQNAQPSLSMDTIRRIIVTLPPLEEQQEIIRIIKKRQQENQALQDVVNSTIKLKENLLTYFQNISFAVLNNAFSGKLVN